MNKKDRESNSEYIIVFIYPSKDRKIANLIDILFNMIDIHTCMHLISKNYSKLDRWSINKIDRKIYLIKNLKK